MTISRQVSKKWESMIETASHFLKDNIGNDWEPFLAALIALVVTIANYQHVLLAIGDSPVPILAFVIAFCFFWLITTIGAGVAMFFSWIIFAVFAWFFLTAYYIVVKIIRKGD